MVSWVLLGPMTMAFGGCLLMGADCDGGPCGSSSAAAFAPVLLAMPQPVAAVSSAMVKVLPETSPRSLEPPPKRSFPAA
jgi:hypothetical protein